MNTETSRLDTAASVFIGIYLCSSVFNVFSLNGRD